VLRTSIVNRAEVPLSGFSKENRFKQYFFDVGLLGAVSGLDPPQILQYDYSNYKGYVAENFVAQELCASGVGELYSWEGRTSEVEFLLKTSSGIIPIEVKSGHVIRSKSLRVFEERYHPVKSIVLSAKNTETRGSHLYLPIYISGRLNKSFT
jgi:predicted AAA+ superfamily ATPase